MIPKEAIEKAIEGGYKEFPFVLIRNPDAIWIDGDKVVAGHESGDWKSSTYLSLKEVLDDWQRIALDPSFWQCLGKALEWPKYSTWTGLDFWDYKAEELVHIILTGGDTDAYWKELLK